MEVDTSNPSVANGFADGVTNGFTSQVPQQPQQGSSPIVGLIVPGGPVLTDFVQMDATGTKFAITLSSPGQLPSPMTLVNELVCFLTSPQSLPPNHGLLIYWQLAHEHEQSGFEFLGSLTADRPSGVIRTGWSEHSQFLAIGPQEQAQVTIGISVEPMESVQNLASTAIVNNQLRRPLVAQKIAENLYNFMSSFDTGAAGSNQMVVPKNIFERWWTRFENKSKRDPNFFLKNSV